MTMANRSGTGGAAVLDAMEPHCLDRLLEPVDVVVNAIGLLRVGLHNPSDSERLAAMKVNAEFPLRLADSAGRLSCRVVHISSDAVFGRGDDDAGEDSVPAPGDLYGVSKALGEDDGTHVVNIRCSVIGPAPGRGGGLWEWFVGQPAAASVKGYVDHRWAGVTSAQLAIVCDDLVDTKTFEAARKTGAAQHFVPNQTVTKYDLLCLLRDVLRPDIGVEPAQAPNPSYRPLVARRGALTTLYSGPRSWTPELVSASTRP